MKNKINQNFINIEPSPILEVGVNAKLYDDCINLSIGDPDIDCNPKIINRVNESLIAGHTHYANPSGLVELKQEIVKYNKEDYNIEINEDEIFVTTSATHALYLVLSAILNPLDEVIVFGPYFTSYKKQTELVGGVLVEVKTCKEEDYQINFDLLEKAINPKTKAIIINSPCNPTGKSFKYETLVKLNEIAKKNNIIIISDEIYTIFTYDCEFIPFQKVNSDLDNVITIRSASKDFTMTGFRVGYIIGEKTLINVINYINEIVVYSAPTMCQYAYLEALKNRKEIYNDVYEEFYKRRNYAYNRLLNIDYLDPVKPDGTIYIWVDIRKLNMTSLEATNYLLEKYHILVLPGNIFGTSGEGFIRIALTVGIEKLKEAFDRLERK